MVLVLSTSSCHMIPESRCHRCLQGAPSPRTVTDAGCLAVSTRAHSFVPCAGWSAHHKAGVTAQANVRGIHRWTSDVFANDNAAGHRWYTAAVTSAASVIVAPISYDDQAVRCITTRRGNTDVTTLAGKYFCVLRHTIARSSLCLRRTRHQSCCNVRPTQAARCTQ